MNETLNLEDMVRLSEFADYHGVTWQAVKYLTEVDIVDHRMHKGRRYIVLTEKTRTYQPNKKHKKDD